MEPNCIGSRAATEKDAEFLTANRERPQHDIPLRSPQILQDFNVAVPYISLQQVAVDPDSAKLIPAEAARRFKVLPLDTVGDRLMLAMVDPADMGALEYVRVVTGKIIEPVRVNADELTWALNHHFLYDLHSSLELALQDPPPGRGASERGLLIQLDQPSTADPVVRLVDSVLIQAVHVGASDIHLEPQENNLRIRLRIDGDLTEVGQLPSQAASPVVSRIKILSGLDIAERRLPQDGRLAAAIDGRDISFRVSSIPSIYGEKLVLRVLDRRSLFSVEQLGLNAQNQAIFFGLLKRPHGLILITGPTGSGKTTTLYAILQHLNLPHRNIITLEDPVEYPLPGITQVQRNDRIGLTFASGLRSALRADPDIIMVGEVRDVETAGLVVQAALTGHLVLATLHTTSAAGTVTRLLDMGIEPFLLSSALIGVVSQRLVRLLCPYCREAYILPGTAAQKMGLTAEPSHFYYRSRGCHLCRHTGYRGRIALQEVLAVDRRLEGLIAQGAVEREIEAAARNAGMITLKEDGLDKAGQGLTTVEEVLRSVSLGFDC